MTLLVGITCADGIVIATDRQVTHGSMGTLTVGQSGSKTTIINEQALYAASGAVSIAQQICYAITLQHGNFRSKKCCSQIAEIQEAIRKVLEPAFAMARTAQQVVGPQAAAQDALCSGLLAARFQDGIRLLDMSTQGGCEILEPNGVPFACHGSGKANADPFLRFLWNTYWPAGQPQPRLTEAVLAAYWTVKVVIDLKTAGVGFDPEVHVLELYDDGKKARARQVTPSELVEHDGFIAAATTAMRDVVKVMRDGPETVPPVDIPTPDRPGPRA